MKYHLALLQDLLVGLILLFGMACRVFRYQLVHLAAKHGSKVHLAPNRCLELGPCSWEFRPTPPPPPHPPPLGRVRGRLLLGLKPEDAVGGGAWVFDSPSKR